MLVWCVGGFDLVTVGCVCLGCWWLFWLVELFVGLTVWVCVWVSVFLGGCFVLFVLGCLMLGVGMGCGNIDDFVFGYYMMLGLRCVGFVCLFCGDLGLVLGFAC